MRPRLDPADYAAFQIWKKSKGDEERRVLVIGDTHEPFCLDDYLQHNVVIKEKYQCNIIIHIGDLVDNHYSSYHETDPDGFSGGDELDLAIFKVKRWKEAFPEVTWIKGNHDAIIERKAMSGGLSKKWIKPYTEVLNLPGWTRS